MIRARPASFASIVNYAASGTFWTAPALGSVTLTRFAARLSARRVHFTPEKQA
jgi:hypothetical protein